MIASPELSERKSLNHPLPETLRSHTGGPRWCLIGNYNTVEAAEDVVRRLEAEGTVATISLLGGLSVIALK